MGKLDAITVPITIDTNPLRCLGETLAETGRTLIRIADELDAKTGPPDNHTDPDMDR